MTRLARLVGLTVLAACPRFAAADADGPDFYRVRDLPAGAVLAIRAEPDGEAELLGVLPHDGDGLRNLGCAGRMSYGAWLAASEEERAAAADRVWCRVEHHGLIGWVRGRFLAEGSAP